MLVSHSAQRELNGNNQEKIMKEETGAVVIFFF